MIEFKNEDRLIVYRSLACETQKKNEAQRRSYYFGISKERWYNKYCIGGEKQNTKYKRLLLFVLLNTMYSMLQEHIIFIIIEWINCASCLIEANVCLLVLSLLLLMLLLH
jgi:hypothetical protein